MINFDDTLAQMRLHGMPAPSEGVAVAIADARAALTDAMSLALTGQRRPLQWLPEYDEVCRWLSHNEGRGLFMYGNCGRGKSLLCRYALPAILLQRMRKVVSVYDMQQLNADIDVVLSKHIIALDDVGTEDVSNTFGNRRMAFAEVMDAAEKHNKLLLISTNLDAAQLRQRYGDRVVERIKATTRRVLFVGESLRTVSSEQSTVNSQQ